MDQRGATMRRMRHDELRGSTPSAMALLRRATMFHLATTTPEGAPVLRTLDAALLSDGLYFHGSRAGEKALCMGRPAVASAVELVAHVPSWMVHPHDASRASTLYRSVQIHGTLREVHEPAEKARALEALMWRWQPEGRHAPIDPSDPHCARALAGTLVFALPFDAIDLKEKLLQNRRPEETLKILEGLWQRGDPGDPEAIEAIRAANPALPAPVFLRAGGCTLHAALEAKDLVGVEALLADARWWEPAARPLIAPAHRGASAWVGARDGDGTLIASARAVSDGRTAWIHDVVVARTARGRGLGSRVLALLLQHPAVRRASTVKVHAHEARGLFARGGFVAAAEAGPRPAATGDLVLRRGAPDTSRTQRHLELLGVGCPPDRG
jgi:nitroimidazol reductase NimA-like FMN-containing flavoprotein (pyridoxamine 5'-phosphate oxidase superfamily)/GNAT superfamily N-acetyltransferase